MGAIKREMNSAKWTAAALGWMTGFAYAVSLMVYQIGTWITGGSFHVWTITALVVLALTIVLLVRPNRHLSAPLKS